MNVADEFERQVQNLFEKDYPALARLNKEEFRKVLDPLKQILSATDLKQEIDFTKGYLPFVIVVTNDLVPADDAMSSVEREGKNGVVKLFPHEPTDFQLIENVAVPATKAYLLIDIDRGKETINLPPKEALQLILQADRSPLTIDEGIAILTHFPEFLIKNNCFSLLASRHPGDKRVPAMWINAQQQPNLGWCWEGNPHTWLGSASCKNRLS